MDLYDYLRNEIGNATPTGAITKIGFASVIFFGGYIGNNNSSSNRNMYSTKGVSIVRKDAACMESNSIEMEFIEVNDKKLYVPRTDGNGKLESMFRIDKIVFDLERKDRYYEGTVYRMEEGGKTKISMKDVEQFSSQGF